MPFVDQQMELRESFGVTVKAIRRAKGLPQIAVGLNQGYVSELENGHKTPTLPKMAAIAKNLGVHPLTLLTAVYSNMGPEDVDQLLARVTSELESLK
ncbi:helix-turn-helix protein [compost metagenome]